MPLSESSRSASSFFSRSELNSVVTVFNPSKAIFSWVRSSLKTFVLFVGMELSITLSSSFVTAMLGNSNYYPKTKYYL